LARSTWPLSWASAAGARTDESGATGTPLRRGCVELRAAIDLQRSDVERRPRLERVGKAGRSLGRGFAMDLDDVPTRHDVASGEVLQNHAWQGPHVERVELDETSGLRGHVVLRLAHRIGARFSRLTGGYRFGQRLHELFPGFELAQRWGPPIPARAATPPACPCPSAGSAAEPCVAARPRRSQATGSPCPARPSSRSVIDTRRSRRCAAPSAKPRSDAVVRHAANRSDLPPSTRRGRRRGGFLPPSSTSSTGS
jgi:hypothetical protein